MAAATSLLLVLLVTDPAGAAGAASSGTYPSHLMVDQEVIVAARITGIVQTIEVDRGSVVAKGQTLATLDPREADADVRQSKEDMELKRIDFERAQALSAGNVLSKSDLDDKRAKYAVAVAAWEKARAMRDYTVIRAPFAGIITEKYARIGQKTIEDKESPLFKLTALEPLLARIYVPEKELLRIRRGTRVEVTAANFPQVRTTGAIEYISPTVDAGSGTFEVIARVKREPSQPILRPGLAVAIRLPETSKRP